MFWFCFMLSTVVAGWYVFEAIWDRRLFSQRCQNLSAQEAKAWLQTHPETQVIDVRSADAFRQGALPDATNISLTDEAFHTKISTLDKTLPVLVYCAGGFRSRKALARLKKLGFGHLLHIHRGYISWKNHVRLSRESNLR
jgi:rhodanese-related sulfurtransferase